MSPRLVWDPKARRLVPADDEGAGDAAAHLPVPDPDPTDLEERLAAGARLLAEAEASAAKARRAQGELVRQALDAGVSYRRIAVVTGASLGAVQRLAGPAKGRGTPPD